MRFGQVVKNVFRVLFNKKWKSKKFVATHISIKYHIECMLLNKWYIIYDDTIVVLVQLETGEQEYIRDTNLAEINCCRE